jgi:hypothetical protein
MGALGQADQLEGVEGPLAALLATLNHSICHRRTRVLRHAHDGIAAPWCPRPGVARAR